jgi:hypothetical protein
MSFDCDMIVRAVLTYVIVRAVLTCVIVRAVLTCVIVRVILTYVIVRLKLKNVAIATVACSCHILSTILEDRGMTTHKPCM